MASYLIHILEDQTITDEANLAYSGLLYTPYQTAINPTTHVATYDERVP